MTTEYQRLEILKKDLGLYFAKISIKLGQKTPQVFYDIKYGISKIQQRNFKIYSLLLMRYGCSQERGKMYFKGGEKEDTATVVSFADAG